MVLLLIILLVSVLADPGSSLESSSNLPFVIRTGGKEPSGIVFHPQRGTLFVMGDEGDIEEIHRDGALVKQGRLFRADFEGITCDPATGLLYAVVEGQERIVEIDPEDFGVLREFAIERTFRGERVLGEGGQGIEAIAFVPDTSHAQGGVFYVGSQSADPKDPHDPSALFEVEVPLRSASAADTTARITRVFRLRFADLSDMHYDRARDRFYCISDALNACFEITRAGVVVKTRSLPGKDQEGITVDGEGFVYIAQDSGGILKLRWERGE